MSTANDIRRVFALLLALLGFHLAGPPGAEAQTTPPDQITYQGRLLDNANVPQTGTFDVTFDFYDAPKQVPADPDGTLLLRYRRDSASGDTGVTATNGIYTVRIGDTAGGVGALVAGTRATLTAMFQNEANVYLEVRVKNSGGAFERLLPRTRLVSVGYALNANSVAGQGGPFVQLQAASPGAAQAGSLNITGTGLIGGSVGIGTTVPADPLAIEGSLNNFLVASIRNLDPGPNAFAYFKAANDVSASTNGSFGVGSSGSTAGVYDSRVFMFSSGTTNGISIITNGPGDDIRLFTGGSAAANERMRIDGNGSVGIGTKAPSTLLDLAGAFTMQGMAPPLGTVAGQGRIYFDTGTGKFKVSENGSGYVDLVGAGTTAFNNISTGTNTTATMTVGTGASLVPSGTGLIRATALTGGGSTTDAVDLATAEVAGTLAVGNGGTGTATAFTTGSVVFAGASGVYAQDNATFFWDNAAKRLGLGTNLPGSTLEVAGQTLLSGGVTGASPTPQLRFASYFDSGGAPSVSHLDLFGGLYGFGITGGTLNVFADNDIAFYEDVGGTPTQRMIILNGGSVGIGSTTPTARLTVTGTTASAFRVETATLRAPLSVNTTTEQVTCASDNTPLTLTGNSGAVGLPDLILHRGSGSTRHFIRFENNNGNQWAVGVDPLGTIQHKFYIGDESGGTNPFVIDSSGNVGINSTNPQERLDVGGAVVIGTSAAANDGTLRWTGTDFEGRKGGVWTSLTAGGGSGTVTSSGPPSAGQVAYWTSATDATGTNNLFWDTTNSRLGIGTAVPGFTLDVANRMRVRQGSSGTAGVWLYQTTPAADRAFMGMVDDNTVGFWGSGGGWLVQSAIATGNTTITGDLRINGNDIQDSAGATRFSLGSSNVSTGNLVPDANDSRSIGTAALRWRDIYCGSSSNLGVHVGNVDIVRSTGSADDLWVSSSNNGGNMAFNFGRAPGWINFYYNNDSYFTIQPTITSPGTVLTIGNNTVGNILVGTAAPAGQGNIREFWQAEAEPRWTLGRDLIANAEPGIAFKTGATGTIAADGGAVGQVALDTLSFFTSNNTSLTERVRITGGGLVGIGTATPANMLHVHNPAAAGGYIRMSNLNTGATGTDGCFIGSASGGEMNIWQYENTYMRFATNNVERMRITNAGDVGIGVTPTTTLDVNGLIRVRNPQGETAAPTRSNNGEFAFFEQSAGTEGRLCFRTNGVNYFIASSGTGDFSEYFRKRDAAAAYEPGDVMACTNDGGVASADGTCRDRLVGVVSAAGTRNNNDLHEGGRDKDPRYVNVGLLGHVEVKVCLEGGEIRPGDFLAPSSIPGVARRASGSGMVVGMALEGFDGRTPGRTKVMTFVRPQYWVDPAAVAAQTAELDALRREMSELRTLRQDLQELKTSAARGGSAAGGR